MANIGYIQVTRECNQKCRFCSNPEMKVTLPLKEAKKQIDDFAARNYRGVILTGGEPTLSDELPRIITYAKKKNIEVRVITNGQKTADIKYLKHLVDCGMDTMSVSIHTYKENLQAFLTENSESLKNIIKTLENSYKLNIPLNINTVINKYNSDHLHEIVVWIVSNFPFIRHFIWNNIDPTTNRATQNPDTIPTLSDFELSLYLGMRFLSYTGRTFRVERVPLCYMTDFAHYSTETRKIVKGEERIVHFLDEKGFVRQTEWKYGKAECCKICSLNSICAGLYEMDTYYSSAQLYPVFIDKNIIINKILNDVDR